MLKLLVFVSTCIFMQMFCGRAWMVFKGPCDNITAVSDFDMDRYVGTWYTYSMYPPIVGSVNDCRKVRFDKTPDGKFVARKSEVSKGTDTLKMFKRDITNVDSRAGAFTLAANTKFPQGVQIYVLDTDYESYSIEYMCLESHKIFHFQWAGIYTRDQLPSEEVVYEAQQLAIASGIKVDKLKYVQQKSCPIK